MQRNIHQLAHIYCQLFKQQQSECLREMFCSRIEVREPVACRWSRCLGFNCVSPDRPGRGFVFLLYGFLLCKGQETGNLR